MKKYNISRKNKTHKKYNKTLIRRINKHFNLTRAMKGGVKKPSVKQLLTLIEDITGDKTFDVAGTPLQLSDVTKEQEIMFVSDALAILKANNKISEDSTQKLNNYIGHYDKKKLHEKEKKSLDLETLINRTKIEREQAEDLLTRLEELDIFKEKPQWRDWLKNYIGLLTNYEYIDKRNQQPKIARWLTTMKVAADAEQATRKVHAERAAADARWAVWAAAWRAAWVVAMREMARETGDEEAMATVEAAVEAAGSEEAAEAEVAERAVKAAEAAVKAAVRGGEATFAARMAAAMLAAAEATGDEKTMARVRARIEAQVDLDARQRQDEADREATRQRRYDEAASMPPEQPLPRPTTYMGGKSKRIIKINVKSKKKRRNRY